MLKPASLLLRRLTLIAMVCYIARAGSQAPAPAPGLALPTLDCSSVLLNLSACLTFAEGGSNLTRPAKGCCPSLAGLVDSQPICLCQLLSSSDTFGIRIDTTRALMLPTACGVSTPPVTLCTDMGIPVASSVVPAPADVPEIPETKPSAVPDAPTESPRGGRSGSPSNGANILSFIVHLLCAGAILGAF